MIIACVCVCVWAGVCVGVHVCVCVCACVLCLCNISNWLKLEFFLVINVHESFQGNCCGFIIIICTCMFTTLIFYLYSNMLISLTMHNNLKCIFFIFIVYVNNFVPKGEQKEGDVNELHVSSFLNHQCLWYSWSVFRKCCRYSRDKIK